MAAPHEEFAGRLRKALDTVNFPGDRARAGALADKYAVSRETTRKWLLGLALPELPRIIELAQDTGASLEWLATGRGPQRMAFAATHVVSEATAPPYVITHQASSGNSAAIKHMVDRICRMDQRTLEALIVLIDRMVIGDEPQQG